MRLTVSDAQLPADSLDESLRLGGRESTLATQDTGLELALFVCTGRAADIRVVQSNNRHHLRLLVEWAHGSSTKVRCQSGNTGNRPVQLHQLGYNLPVLLDENTATNTEITVPPRAVQRSGVGCNAELYVACLGPQVGDGDRKSTRLNSSHSGESRMPSSA